jgi:hypothetical protein
MGCLLISSEHVANLIDKAIEDTNNGLGFRLYDLASVLDSIAEAQDQPILHVVPQAVGGFGNTLVNARAIVALPVLPEPMRQRINALIKISVEDATTSLKTIKDELCSKDDPEYKTLMNAIGVLFKQAGILLKESRAVSSRRQPHSSMGFEE